MAVFATKLDTLAAKRWGFTARVVAHALDLAVTSGRVDSAWIPVGVMASARQFFKLALSARTPSDDSDLQASVANYRIAADAVRSTSDAPVTTRDALERQMAAFADFLPRLATQRTLSAPEVETAKQLKRFFERIVADAGAEDYDKYARGAQGSFRVPAH